VSKKLEMQLPVPSIGPVECRSETSSNAYIHGPFSFTSRTTQIQKRHKHIIIVSELHYLLQREFVEEKTAST